MAIYTLLNRADIQNIMSEFGITDISNFKQLSGGSENSNYVITSSVGKYVLTICEQKTDLEAQNLALLLEHLEANKFSTSKIVRTIKGETTSRRAGKPIMVKKFINGEIYDPIPEEFIGFIGKELAKLHQIQAPSYLPKAISYGIQNFKEVANYAPNSTFHSWIQDKHAYIHDYITDSLPKALIHSDLFCSNIIIDKSENTATIMDFEEASYYYRIFDIGMTIVGICKNDGSIELKKVNRLLIGYSEIIKLTEEEINSLQAFVVYAATAMTFWRHKNFNEVNPTPSLFDHYKELQTIADSAINIDNQVFLGLLK